MLFLSGRPKLEFNGADAGQLERKLHAAAKIGELPGFVGIALRAENVFDAIGVECRQGIGPLGRFGDAQVIRAEKCDGLLEALFDAISLFPVQN